MNVLVNGLPGKMAHIVAEVCAERGFELVPFSLTGEDVSAKSEKVGNADFELLKPSEREDKIAQILKNYPNLISVDYTHPSAVNCNAEFYVKHKIPFVMGTTGGDREALMSLVKSVNHPCIIAPNMAKQIVAFQAMLEWTAANFPSAFNGYSLSVVESHQKTKADTSGTAKAVVKSLLGMGAKFNEGKDIEMVRDENNQVGRMAVPEEHLGGHAFHTYSLDSSDNSVHFEFRHNVCGRRIYAEGTADAVQFLSEKITQGRVGVFDMIAVLRG
ncbi:4-hydroxy-tetrahydrodipicolinate reductase [Fibrobacterales bacterium]|nr:4-hydroxy-tetrahydrodipicolinate reductase [Fibrobacterales bacterium]